MKIYKFILNIKEVKTIYGIFGIYGIKCENPSVYADFQPFFSAVDVP